MKENKIEIVEALEALLKKTYYFNDLKELRYDEKREAVVATFENGFTKTASVAMDSGVAIIKDVLRQIM